MIFKSNNKILFVTFNSIGDLSYGGGQCSTRNARVLEMFGEVILYSVFKKSSIASLKSALEGNFPPFSDIDEEKILSLLKNDGFSCVFLDSTLTGKLAKKIKNRLDLPVISFCHNVEIDYINVRFGKNPIRFLYKVLAWKSEKNIMKFSDKVIVLTQRDKERIAELYNRDPEYILPITIKTNQDVAELERKYKALVCRQNYDKVCLFVGSLGNSKLEGIRWFVENVAPALNAKIKIVGKGFDSVASLLSRDNVEVFGFVEDLERTYLEADCVIVPLMSGAGMKVKVAEALMYGKTIFGTSEAFEGYDLDFDRVGGVCNSASEFVSRLNSYLSKSVKYNSFSRQQFEEMYRDDVAYNCFKHVLVSL
jgi:glycosyltransferase involved in cell wall biosynthesis